MIKKHSIAPFLFLLLAGSGWAQTLDDITEASGIHGGFVVQVGTDEPELPFLLAKKENFQIQVVDTRTDRMAELQERLKKQSLYGRVTATIVSGKRLPYADNLVNLIVATSNDIPEAELKRVLAPLGAIVNVKDGKATRTFVKPWPADIAHWTHYLYDASNNAVAPDDRVAPPKQIRWRASPKWARSHDHLATMSALVSNKGRIFYIFDEAPAAMAALPAQWSLIARDAFSGVLLWKRPISRWEGQLRGFRTGPTELQRRLVAAGDRVYITLGYGEPVTALDATTGRTVHTYDQTPNALEIIVHNNKLIAVLGDRAPDNLAGQGRSIKREGIWMHWPIYRQTAPDKKIVAIDLKSGNTLWEQSGEDSRNVLPMTLIADDRSVYFQNFKQLVAVDAATGKARWKADRTINRKRPEWSTPTVVAVDGVVISADRSISEPPSGVPKDNQSEEVWLVNSMGGHAPDGEMIAFSAADGKKLWQAPCKEVYNAPVDILVVNGLVWSGKLVRKNEPGMVQALDLKTGEVKKTRQKDQTFYRIIMGHHRCYRNKATRNYLVLGRDGTEYVDVKSGKLIDHHWFRGMCQYGVMPANGLTYAPPHSCACHIESKLDSFLALSAQPMLTDRTKPSSRLVKGDAYGQAITTEKTSPNEWPTYRQNNGRTGKTPAPVPQAVNPTWTTDLGGALTQPVIAGERLYVACKATHTVYALNAEDGKQVWSFTAGAKVDSPPTLFQGRALFGCHDGWIYCLRATDGALIWRYLAAPADVRILSDGCTESPWPIHGGVLVQDGILHAAVGRTPFLEGGLQICRLKVDSGERLSSTPVKGRSLPDVLSSDGTHLFMRHVALGKDGRELKEKKRHLYSPAGFLDGNFWHRTYWQYGDSMGSNYGGWPQKAKVNIAGRILVSDGKTVFGYGRHNQYSHIGSHVGMSKVRNLLFSAPLQQKIDKKQAQAVRRWNNPTGGIVKSNWKKRVPVWVRGMVLAPNALFIAGPPDLLEAPKDKYPDHYTLAPNDSLKAQYESLAGKKGASLCTVNPADGAILNTLKLSAPPVWDGMAATNGRLFLCLTNGQVVCCGK